MLTLFSHTLTFGRKDAVFINIGRGDVITEEDLIKALDADWISAAILDVFIAEPLSSNSRLWFHPKVGSVNLFCRTSCKIICRKISYQTQST